MYFGSTRSDATFCGVTCANGFNAQIGIYDNPEINRLYKRIVSALRVRIESRDKQGLAYIRKYDPTLAKVDLDAWKDAFHKEYRERTKELKNLKQTSKRDQFDRKVSELQIWLEAALAQVHNFVPEQLTE